MGAFNVVRALVLCPQCKRLSEFEFQFKYGNVRQEQYALGDPMRWGGNDVGDSSATLVVVGGVLASACGWCSYFGDLDIYIFVDRNKICDICVADGRYNFAEAGKPYIVIRG